jgi:hypothetical protein
VPAIGYVLGVRKGLGNSGCKLLTPISRHDVDSGVALERSGSRAIGRFRSRSTKIAPYRSPRFQAHSSSPMT